ncbi:cytochrome c6, chloroplastic isoform X2 [Diospyros lotus]|nr:cytochrome c6, chloroplastic isoform X2 [Diospyros lotus]
MKSLAPSLMAAALLSLSPAIFNPPASIGQVMDVQRGATLFRQACIGCHDGGGNIIQPGATLFLKDLQRNGVDTEEEIYRVTYYGKGRMPGFGENCTPRGQCTFGARLQENEIKALAEFVKSQAGQGWPNIESFSD